MNLPWDYKTLIEQYINRDMQILDYDTGGGDNDRDLVEMVLSNTEKPFPHLNLTEQKKLLKNY